MRIIHVGVRPTYPLELIDFKKKIWEEKLPDGTKIRWNTKLLKSGCGESTRRLEVLMGCFYCPTCKEYFNVEQWQEDV